MAFNPNEHLMQLQGKDYLEVKWRLSWFRDLCPNGTVETEMLHLDLDREVTAEVWVWNNDTRKREKVLKTAKGYCVFHAVVKDGNGGVGSGTKSEAAVDFADFIEKAESGAIGRALATLGYGTQFTGDELDEGKRIVDSPVDRNQATSASPSAQPRANQPTQVAHSSKPEQPAKPAEQKPAQNGNAPRPVSLATLKDVAGKKYPGGWSALKAKIVEEFKLLGDVSDELIASEYNTDAQAFVKEAMKQPAAVGSGK